MKIAPEELRIGNWVYRTIEETYEYQVKAEDFPQNLTTVYHAPIPITEEWLLRLGWEKTNFGEQISFKCRGQLIYEQWIDGVYHVRFHATNKMIQHVHKLMNLYFELQDEELSIKPTIKIA